MNLEEYKEMVLAKRAEQKAQALSALTATLKTTKEKEQEIK